MTHRKKKYPTTMILSCASTAATAAFVLLGLQSRDLQGGQSSLLGGKLPVMPCLVPQWGLGVRLSPSLRSHSARVSQPQPPSLLRTSVSPLSLHPSSFCSCARRCGGLFFWISKFNVYFIGKKPQVTDKPRGGEWRVLSWLFPAWEGSESKAERGCECGAESHLV